MIKVINQLLEMGYHSCGDMVSIEEDRYLGYYKKDEEIVLITVAKVTGKWIVEILRSIETFEIKD